jgi:hypothetical protein
MKTNSYVSTGIESSLAVIVITLPCDEGYSSRLQLKSIF